MKKQKLLWLLPAVAALAAILLLCFPPGEDGWRPAASRPHQTPTEELDTSTSSTSLAETKAQTTEPTVDDLLKETEDHPEIEPPQTQTTEPPPVTPIVEVKKLEYSGFGRYSGAYVEDGFDAQVENVAVMLVSNVSQEFLEFASIKYLINGEDAEFIVNGLPPGTSAWVLEANRMVIPPASNFTYVDETTGFSHGGNLTDDLVIELGEGTMTVLNTGDTVMKDVYVYYKQLHTDGNFLGGIAYRVSFGDLQPDNGETPVAVTATAGHCTPDGCVVVKATKDEKSP